MSKTRRSKKEADATPDVEVEETHEEKFNTLTTAELRKLLKQQGLKTKGDREVLLQRLKSNMDHENSEKPHEGLPANKEHVDISEYERKLRREKILRMNMESITEEILQLTKEANRQVKLENLLKELNELKERYLDLSNEIIDLLPSDSVEEECKKRTQYQKELRNIINTAQEYISERTASDLESRSSRNESNLSEGRSQGIKLPKLELPKFYGDVLKFTAYWDQFKCAVHDKEDLSDVQKFVYLRSTLKASALQAIDGFEVTSANYEHAVAAILHRFGRKRVIVSTLVKSIIKMESTEKIDAKSLRELQDTLQNRIRALEGLGFKPEDNIQVQMIIIPLLVMKLPQKLAEKWELEISDVKDEDATIDLFFKFLSRQVFSKEAGERSVSNPSDDQSNSKNEKMKFKKQEKTSQEPISTASALLGNAESSSMKLYCAFCKGNHEAFNCKNVEKKRPVEDRWNCVRENKLCFNCLRHMGRNHTSTNCWKPGCTVEGCGKRHHYLLHKGSNTTESTFNGFASSKQTASEQTLLQTAIAKLVVNGSQEIPVRVLLDPGSQRSYIKKSVAESYDLQGPVEQLRVSTLGGDKSRLKRMNRVSFSLTSMKTRNTGSTNIEALTIEKICSPLDPVSIDISKYPHLKNLKFSETYPRGSAQVDILIGADHYYDIVDGTRCKKSSLPNSPVAVGSKLGWLLCGPVQVQNTHGNSTKAMLSTTESDHIQEAIFSVKRFWELESMGITDDNESTWSLEEENAMLQFQDSLQYSGERYTVSLPWKKDHPPLKNNFSYACRRLESVENRLKKNKEDVESYNKAINQYIEDGQAKEVTSEEVADEIRYLPHHAVIKEDKSTKVRVVFDASSKIGNEASLNDCILTGPPLQPNLLSVLIRFRVHKIALIADVKKMFLQIKMAEKDQDVLRYLWRDVQTNQPPKIYKMTRLPFGLNCSPFLAMATVRHHAEKCSQQFPEAAEEVLSNMYVDDCLTGTEDEENAVELQQSLKEMMRSAGFDLSKWASNSEIVLSHIGEDERAQSPRIDYSEPLKALGILWDTVEDMLLFDVSQKIFEQEDNETKRSVLSISSKIFDPMGLISPFVIRAKLMFQELWQRGLQWDERLEEDIAIRWRAWKAELSELCQIRIPRCFSCNLDVVQRVELHGFGDASLRAYGSAVYLRIIDNLGQVRTQLVISKSRVAPVKKISLPRLELLAAVVNTRLLKFVVDSLKLKLDRIYCWTDSMVTLYWIKRQISNWKPFVANRVGEIQTTWSPEHWNHCPGKSNPADLLTRGITTKELKDNDLWWKGPTWLSLPEETWPNDEESVDVQECMNEARKNTHVFTTLTSESEVPIDASRYSTWSKLIRVTAYVLRVFRNFRLKKQGKQAILSELKAEELRDAEYFWFAEIQMEVYPEELERLRNEKGVKRTSRILKLDPYFDKSDKVLRVGGRLQNSDFAEETKHQVILPHGHLVVEKLIQDIHEKSTHAGPETTLSILREKIWLTQGRRDIKRVIRKCLICKRQSVKACSQKMGLLPSERVTYSHPFTHVGIDFAGPLYIKIESGNSKAYICIFTCASSRMVHLELTNSMNTDEFLQALHRMINRRGHCDTIWSDNAKTFKAADRGLRELAVKASVKSNSIWEGIDEDKVIKDLSSRGIKWKFIAERSPWRGGWWERIVRSVKEPLRKILGKALLSYSELNTILTDIEAVVNSRPLTRVGDDIRDPEPITPAHLAIGRSLRGLPDVSTVTQNNNNLVRRYLYRQRLVNQFWKRWSKCYLQELNVRHKWNIEQPEVKIGEVVLISEDNTRRCKWPMGRITDVHPGKDGLIRTVTLKTSTGELKRPVQRLHRLEITDEYTLESPKVEPDEKVGDDVLEHNDERCEIDILPEYCGEDVVSRYGRKIKRVNKLNYRTF